MLGEFRQISPQQKICLFSVFSLFPSICEVPCMLLMYVYMYDGGKAVDCQEKKSGAPCSSSNQPLQLENY